MPNPRRATRTAPDRIGYLMLAIVFVVFPSFVAYRFYCELMDSYWTPERVSESRASGESIARAVTKYHQQTGRHPERLKDLVPDYLSAIPRPTAGIVDWQYHIEPEGDFTLTFMSSYDAYPSATLRGSTMRWKTDE